MLDRLYFYKATVVKVIDGDTVDVIISKGFDDYYGSENRPIRLRLARINTPEIRTRDLQEKKRGLAAKSWLEKVLPKGQMIVINTIKDDSFGRWISELFVDNGSGRWFNINSALVDTGHAIYKRY